MKISKILLKAFALTIGLGIIIGMFFLSKLIYPSITSAPWFIGAFTLIAVIGGELWVWEIIDDK